MNSNLRPICLIFTLCCSLSSLQAVSMTQCTEVGLAALNFSLGATIAYHDSGTVEQETLIKLQAAREAVRSLLDIFAIKNHHNYYTAPLWLVRDLWHTAKLFHTNADSIYEKPPLCDYGIWDALESLTVICAALIHDSSQNLANPQRKAIILQSISSLARLHNTQSPNKIFISLNLFFTIFFCIYRKISVITAGIDEPYVSLSTQFNQHQANLSSNGHRSPQHGTRNPAQQNNNSFPNSNSEASTLHSDTTTRGPILFTPFSCTEGLSTPQDQTIRVAYNANAVPVESSLPAGSLLGFEWEDSTITTDRQGITITRIDDEGNEQVAVTYLYPRDNATRSIDAFRNAHYVITPCNHIQQAHHLHNRDLYNRYRWPERCDTCNQNIPNSDELRYVFLPVHQATGEVPAYRYTDNIERAFQTQSRQAYGYDQVNP